MFTIFLELEVDRNVGSKIHGQWVQPEGSVVASGTWIHATSLVDMVLDKNWGHFNVADCWMRWLACRYFPARYNQFPMHARVSQRHQRRPHLLMGAHGGRQGSRRTVASWLVFSMEDRPHCHKYGIHSVQAGAQRAFATRMQITIVDARRAFQAHQSKVGSV